MNVIDNSSDVSLTNLTPEFKKSNNAVPPTATKETDELTKIDVDIHSAESKVADESVDSPLSSQQLEKVAQQLQDFVGDMNRGLEFSVDKDSGRDVIKVIDKSSGDLVKQYPSEEVLTLVAKLSDSVGGFIDAKV